MYVYILFPIPRWWASLVAQTVKRLQCGRPRFEPWVGKIPWRRKWQSTPGLLSGKSHGQRSLVGYSPWGRKESDTTERLRFTSLWFPSYIIDPLDYSYLPLFPVGISSLKVMSFLALYFHQSART